MLMARRPATGTPAEAVIAGNGGFFAVSSRPAPDARPTPPAGHPTAGHHRPVPRGPVVLGHPGRRRAHRDAKTGQRGDQPGPRRGGPGRDGRPDPPLPLRRLIGPSQTTAPSGPPIP